VIILVSNNFLFFKLISKLVTLVTNNFWSLKLIINQTFSYNIFFMKCDYKSYLLY